MKEAASSSETLNLRVPFAIGSEKDLVEIEEELSLPTGGFFEQEMIIPATNRMT